MPIEFFQAIQATYQLWEMKQPDVFVEEPIQQTIFPATKKAEVVDRINKQGTPISQDALLYGYTYDLVLGNQAIGKEKSELVEILSRHPLFRGIRPKGVRELIAKNRGPRNLETFTALAEAATLNHDSRRLLNRWVEDRTKVTSYLAVRQPLMLQASTAEPSPTNGFHKAQNDKQNDNDQHSSESVKAYMVIDTAEEKGEVKDAPIGEQRLWRTIILTDVNSQEIIKPEDLERAIRKRRGKATPQSIQFIKDTIEMLATGDPTEINNRYIKMITGEVFRGFREIPRGRRERVLYKWEGEDTVVVRIGKHSQIYAHAFKGYKGSS